MVDKKKRSLSQLVEDLSPDSLRYAAAEVMSVMEIHLMDFREQGIEPSAMELVRAAELTLKTRWRKEDDDNLG